MRASQKTSLAVVAFLAGIAGDHPAAADDEAVTATLEGGVMRLRATESVYVGSFKLSELDWKSTNVPVLRGTIAVNITPEWQIRAEARIAGLGKGDGHMTDYDWVPPYYTDTTKAGWSDQSQHDDTSLDHYRAANVEVLRKFLDDRAQSLSAGFGAGYTDLQWTARGGTFVYSANGTRDTIGSFTPGVRGASYRQQIPTAYALVEGAQKFGGLSLEGGLRGGVMFAGRTTDEHWLRDLSVTDTFDPAPTFGMSLALSYDLTRSAAAYLRGSYDYVNLGRGPSTYRDNAAGTAVTYGDTGSAKLETIYVGGGVKGRF